jgi:hypothetical protein
MTLPNLAQTLAPCLGGANTVQSVEAGAILSGIFGGNR